MPRPYHSPSSIALGRRCQRAWAESYIARKRDPDVDWFVVEAYKWDRDASVFVSPAFAKRRERGYRGKPAPEDMCTAKARGAALGKVMHGTLERWYRPDLGAPDWHTYPGQVAKAGLHFLPHPSRCVQVVTEEAIGTTSLPVLENAREGAPTIALEIDGILWAGFRDLLVNSPIEIARMGLVSPSGWLLADYKSSASIDEHALTEAELLDDPQANLYGIDVCAKLGLSSIAARWVYFESKKVRKAEPRDVTIELSRAHDVMGPCVELARELDSLTCVEDAPLNPLACEDYGPPGQINCEYHVSKGGTCRPKRTAGALIAQLDRRKRVTEEKKEMALSPEQQAKFAKMQADKKAAAAAAAGPKTEPAPAPPPDDMDDTDARELQDLKSDPEGEAEVAEASSQAVATPVTKPIQTTRIPATKPVKAAPGGTAATVTALAAELATHEKAIADATTAHAAVKAKIVSALG